MCCTVLLHMILCRVVKEWKIVLTFMFLQSCMTLFPLWNTNILYIYIYIVFFLKHNNKRAYHLDSYRNQYTTVQKTGVGMIFTNVF